MLASWTKTFFFSNRTKTMLIDDEGNNERLMDVLWAGPSRPFVLIDQQVPTVSWAGLLIQRTKKPRYSLI